MTGTHRIEIPEEHGGGWVDIRASRSLAARKKIQSAGIGKWTPGGETDGGAVIHGVDMLEMALVQAETAIVGWSLPYPADTPAKVREALMSDEFDEDLGDWLLNEIDAYYNAKKRSADEAKT